MHGSNATAPPTVTRKTVPGYISYFVIHRFVIARFDCNSECKALIFQYDWRVPLRLPTDVLNVRTFMPLSCGRTHISRTVVLLCS